MTYEVNQEAVNDRAKLLMHRLVARRISQQPELIDAARGKLSQASNHLESANEWFELLNNDPSDIRREITSRSQRMTRLRLSSPLHVVPELQDPVVRRRIWKAAKKGHLTSPATVE